MHHRTRPCNPESGQFFGTVSKPRPTGFFEYVQIAKTRSDLLITARTIRKPATDGARASQQQIDQSKEYAASRGQEYVCVLVRPAVFSATIKFESDKEQQARGADIAL